MMRRNVLISVFIVTLLLGSITIYPESYTSPATKLRVTAYRSPTISVKILLMGFDNADVPGLLKALPERRYQLVNSPGVSTNVVFQIVYNVSTASKPFQEEFSAFLASVAKGENSSNPFFKKPVYNTFYPAGDVEEWLYENREEYGGLPDNGYTIIVADISNMVPSLRPEPYRSFLSGNSTELTPHYYNKTFVDPDLGLQANKRWMTGWGGRWRLYFLDLSAGPSYVTRELPIQVSASNAKVDLSRKHGSLWLSRYLADYLSGVISNLFLPDFLYQIKFANYYNVSIVVFDNRTDGAGDIRRTINEELIRDEVQRLVPFAKVAVETDFLRMRDFPSLVDVMRQNARAHGGQLAIDVGALYNWLSEREEGNLKLFLSTSPMENQQIIPVLVFALNGSHLAMLRKGDIHGASQLRGVAFPDLILVGQSIESFTAGNRTEPKQPGKGLGVTNTVIHEIGHALGLMHTFHTLYDPTENFVSSVMAYYPSESGFSQFDRDVVSRGHADFLIMNATLALSSTPVGLLSIGYVSAARESLLKAELSYRMMDYEAALREAREAISASGAAKRLSLFSIFT